MNSWLDLKVALTNIYLLLHNRPRFKLSTFINKKVLKIKPIFFQNFFAHENIKERTYTLWKIKLKKNLIKIHLFSSVCQKISFEMALFQTRVATVLILEIRQI